MPELSSDRTATLVQGMTGRRIVVVGDIMLDHFLWGSVHRISPEAPVPVVHVQRESYHPGGCGNVAANLAALGAVPLVVAPVGSDRAGKSLQEVLQRQGIDPSHLLVGSSRVTTKKTRIVAHHQQVVRFDREQQQDLESQLEARLIGKATELMQDADAIVLSDYDKGALNRRIIETLLSAARKMGCIAAVDPKPRLFPNYRFATLVTPNLTEASRALDIPLRNDDDVLRAGREIREMLGAEGILITRGEQGMSLFEAEERVTHIPATAHEVFDVTGAGDTVIATAVLGLAAGGTLLESAILANAAAGIAIGKLGTATVSQQELM